VMLYSLLCLLVEIRIVLARGKEDGTVCGYTPVLMGRWQSTTDERGSRSGFVHVYGK
jgi:hypothetical protein